MSFQETNQNMMNDYDLCSEDHAAACGGTWAQINTLDVFPMEMELTPPPRNLQGDGDTPMSSFSPPRLCLHHGNAVRPPPILALAAPARVEAQSSTAVVLFNGAEEQVTEDRGALVQVTNQLRVQGGPQEPHLQKLMSRMGALVP
jgi:hypothetical protein